VAKEESPPLRPGDWALAARPGSAPTRLRDFAASLGLSPTTVSRALDGYPDVAPGTRERVRQAALASGYRPDPAARRLRRGRPEAVGVILPADRGRIGPPVFLDMLARTAERLAQEGIDLLLVPSATEQAETEAFRRMVEGGRVDAMIVLRTRWKDPRVEHLLDHGIPFVTHGRTEASELHGFVDGDGQAGFRSATLDLVRRGHVRIGHVSAPQGLTFARLRRAGWRDALAEADLAPGPEAQAPPTEAGGFEATRALLGSFAPPTALVCATDALGIGAILAARQAGLEPGRDLSIVGHDNLAAGAFFDPPLSTMEIDAPDQGGLLAELMLARLAGGSIPTLQRLLPVRQIVRATTGHGPSVPLDANQENP